MSMNFLDFNFLTRKIIIIVLFSPLLQLFSQDLPPIDIDYASYAVTSDGKLIGYFGEKRRVEVESTGYISKYVLYSLVATEDRDFYNHDGVSYKGLGRAVIQTLTGSTQGGSTLTMQLARNLFLTNEKTISRKLTEINLAKDLEKKFSKDQILLLYLNTVNFGHGTWGIWAASQEYFSKTPDKLNITESAMLVGLLQSPNGYDPLIHPEKALNRRNEVLYNLVEVGKLSQKEFEQLKKKPLGLNPNAHIGRHFLEHIRKELQPILKSKGLSLNKDQLRIVTTLDYEMQKAAENAVEKQWENFPQSMKSAQAGLVSVEVGTGRIRAIVGGNPESAARGLNHADEIKRQPGSSFKPFLYGSLLEQGYTLATPILDEPITVTDTITGQDWSPMNSDNNFRYADVPMISAVQHSINTCAAHAITKLTIPDSVAAFAKRCGIQSDILPYPSIALGTSEVTPLEMAASCAVFASYGKYAKPFSILKVEDRKKRWIYGEYMDTISVLDSATCYLVTTALQTVVDSGTAASVRRYYKGTAAGKTGTTQNSTDAWFVGYNPILCTAIWIGYDDARKKLGGGFQYGGSACAPIWGQMMAETARKTSGFYSAPFIRPESIQDVEMCEESGEPAGENCLVKKLYPVNFLKLKGSCSLHENKFDVSNDNQ